MSLAEHLQMSTQLLVRRAQLCSGECGTLPVELQCYLRGGGTRGCCGDDS
jgi:hypothetical protein